MSKSDPHLPAAEAAVEEFKAKKLTAEQAMSIIWESMRKAEKERRSLDPYVKLTDKVTFGEAEPDPDQDAAIAATWRDDGFD